MSEFQCSSSLVIWLSIALLPTFGFLFYKWGNIGIYAHLLSFQGLDEIVHAKCLVWYLTPRQYVVNLASPFFRHLLSRIRQKCHNQRCWWQEAWAKQAEELLGCICQLWCALKKLKLGALGHELFPQLGKEAGPRKEQTSFQSIIGKCKKKKSF